MTEAQRETIIDALSAKKLLATLIEIRIAKKGYEDFSRYQPTTAFEMLCKQKWLCHHLTALEDAAQLIGFTAKELLNEG